MSISLETGLVYIYQCVIYKAQLLLRSNINDVLVCHVHKIKTEDTGVVHSVHHSNINVVLVFHVHKIWELFILYTDTFTTITLHLVTSQVNNTTQLSTSIWPLIPS